MNAHHVVPIAAGGEDHPRNMLLLCPNHHAIAHHLWSMSPGGVYRGPRTPHDFIWLLRAFEADPSAYYEARLRLVL